MADKKPLGPPTAAQVTYLLYLVDRHGITFSIPKDIRAASRQIKALESIPFPDKEESEAEEAVAADEVGTDGEYAPAVSHDDETEGHGSSARWKGASA